MAFTKRKKELSLKPYLTLSLHTKRVMYPRDWVINQLAAYKPENSFSLSFSRVCIFYSRKDKKFHCHTQVTLAKRIIETLKCESSNSSVKTISDLLNKILRKNGKYNKTGTFGIIIENIQARLNEMKEEKGQQENKLKKLQEERNQPESTQTGPVAQ